MTSEMTSEQPSTPPRTEAVTGVVVGVDDSASARAAVAWAATAARHRGVDLHLVEVLPADGTTNAATEARTPHGRARALLLRAQAIALAVDPGLTVTMQTLSGRVAPALVGYAAEASLLVVGSNGPGGPIPLSLGSIVGGVTRDCPCPVVLVPATSSTSAAAGRPVVVALEDTPDGEQALAFAADAAARRDVALAPLVSADASGAEQPVDGSPQLARIRATHPTLVVEPQTITERPAQALLHDAADAQLIVVPSVGRGRRRSGVTAGWTGHFLPVLSTCPVAVVSTHTRSSTTLA